MRVVVTQDERYPTLSCDDMTWAEPESIAIYEAEGKFVEVPDELIESLNVASKALVNAESAIREHLGWEH